MRLISTRKWSRSGAVIQAVGSHSAGSLKSVQTACVLFVTHPPVLLQVALLFFFLLLISLPVQATAQIEIESNEREELALFFDSEELYVQSASRLRETISEAPAIVNIITARDIRKLGARNLMDVLLTVPGFSEIQDTNEKVLAGRGIFSTTTQKFLLLRDGHRLNDPMFEEMMPANSISLPSIKRIEVLRGTGASLYGNSALLGVINIITLDRDASSQAALIVGNFGQTGADFIFNEKLSNNRQLLLFGSLRDVKGEVVNLPADQDMAANPVAGSQRVESRPYNFDVGMKYRGERSQLSLSARRAAYNTPRANDGALLTVSETLNTPLQVFDFQHLDLQFTPEWNEISFMLRHYLDRSELNTPQYITTARDAAPSGSAFNLRMESYRAGIEYSGQLEHDGGTLVFGMQLENFWMTSSSVEKNIVGGSVLIPFPAQDDVSEWNSALYVQEKYSITPNLILNAGLRLDYYQSFGSSLNPRLALIYNPAEQLYLKFIYGRAFQAPSYFYRSENLGLGYGSPTGLRPEIIDNIQVSLENSFAESTWLRISAFHNNVRDLISRPAGATNYQNIGMLATHGLESELKFRPAEVFEVFMSHTLIAPTVSHTSPELVVSGSLDNIPRQSIVAGITWDDESSLSGSIYVKWRDKITSPVIGPTAAQSDPLNTIPAVALVNATFNMDDVFAGMDMQLAIHNLFDKRDWLGGTTRIPYPQEGRNILLTIGYPL